MPLPSRQFLLTCVALLAAAATAQADPSAAPAQLQHFLRSHCHGCHDSNEPAGGLDLTSLAWPPDDADSFARWVTVLDRVEQGEMPPADEPRPDRRVQAAAMTSLGDALRSASLVRRRQAGRVGLRRLNRVQYESTVRDLLGIDVALRGILPEDTPTDGFDTVADGLRLSALHLEKYLEAADAALDATLVLKATPQVQTQRFPYKEQEGIRKNLPDPHANVLELADAIVLFSDASYITKLHGFHVQHAGNYRIRARGWAHESEHPVVLRLHAGNYRSGTAKLLGYFDMPTDAAREVELVARLEVGDYLYPAPDDLDAPRDGKNLYNVGAKKYQGSGLAVEWIEVEGPLLDAWPPRGLTRLLAGVPIEPLPEKLRKKGDRNAPAYRIAPAAPHDDMRRILVAFATRAFRRPLEPGDEEPFVRLAVQALDAGQPFEMALRVGVRTILTSPQFLFFEERPGTLDEYALASRLSYFLWSTLPDEPLMQLAAANKLSHPDALRSEVERMLASPRSAAFVENFTGQWLDLRSIDATSPDRRLYPEFDEILKLSMVRETEEFFAAVLAQDLSVDRFVHSDFTVLNRRLAEHYGVPGVIGEEFRKVLLPADSHRGGVLTQAAVLKVTANGTVTSPVLRGAWVLKHLLGKTPRPPPPGVGAIEPDTRGATTVREQLALHRDSATCSACHAAIDPPGFALESFDVIGGWREHYRSQEKGDRPNKMLHGRPIWEYKHGPPVDAGGTLADGRTFADIDEFKKLLLTNREQIARAVVAHLLTYGTGAVPDFADRTSIEAILDRGRPRDLGLRTLIHEVVQSSLFRNK